MRIVLLLLAVSIPWLPATVRAQQRPDFSGEWTLDRSTSALQGEMTSVEGGSIRVQHRDPSFGFTRTFVIKAQPIDTAFEIQTDGREVANSNRGTISNVVRYELLDGGRTLRAVEDVGGAAPSHHNVWMFARR